MVVFREGFKGAVFYEMVSFFAVVTASFNWFTIYVYGNKSISKNKLVWYFFMVKVFYIEVEVGVMD